MRIGKKPVFGVMVLAVAGFYGLGLQDYFTLDFLHESHAALLDYRQLNPVLSLLIYFLGYVAVTALSLPGAAVMSLAGGAVFGFWQGLMVVSFASSVGATLAMLVARFLLRDWIAARFGARVAAIDAGVARDGAFHLFALRLVPLFPFFLVNLALGLTRMPARRFYWVSQLGMLPGTVVFVNVGTQLAGVDSLHGLLSPGLLGSFALLGVFPLLARAALQAWQRRKRYAPWPRPRAFDFNLAVIGAGSGGLVSAYIGAATQARVALIEAGEFGGDCLNTGCVPSKTLLRSARLLQEIREAERFGLREATASCDFGAVMARVAETVREIAPHDSIARYSAMGVECIEGRARLLSPWEIEIQVHDGIRRITAAQMIVATGARPTVPELPGLEDVGYLTSETVWSLRELPARMLVLGGGPIGCELAQAFARFGAQVVVVQRAERLLPKEDPEVSALLVKRFAREGIAVLCGATPVACEIVEGEKSLRVVFEGKEIRIAFDALLVAVGRTASAQGFGLEALGIELNPDGTIAADEFLATSLPNIHVCGDVAGPFQLTHAAAHQAWYAAVNALFGRFRRFRVDYRVMPWCTFTEPEVARVGLSETEARAQGIAHEVTRYALADLDRAITDGTREGFVKVLTPPGSDRILGVTVMGAQAGELIATFVLAMKHRLGLNKVLATTHIYPTLNEANKYAAGAWKRAQVTVGQRALLRAMQEWQRGTGRLGQVFRALPGLLRKQRAEPGDPGH